MEAWLREFFGWLPSGGTYYLLIGVISFLESLVAVGIFVPGSVLIVFAGFLAAHGKGTYALLMLAATLGAVAGDLISYWAGARLGASLLQRPLLQKRRSLVRRAELFFVDHGGKSVFIGRFFGPLRPFIPFVAGAGRMRVLPFTVFVLLSGILWGIAYPGLGYFFGASWKLVQVWTGRFSLFVGIIVALLAIDAAFWKWGAPALGRLWSQIVARGSLLWGRFSGTPVMNRLHRRHPRIWNFIADRLTLRSGSGLFLTCGFVAVVFLVSVVLLLGRWTRLTPYLVQLDSHIHQVLATLHNPTADRLFLAISQLGSWPVLLALGVLLLLWLVLRNRDFSALILCVGMGGGKLLVDLLIRLFERSGPVPLFPSLELSVRHAFLAPAFYGMAIYMLLDHLENWRSRFNLVFTGSFLVLLVGTSSLYLGLNWFSEVVGAIALAAAWLTVLVAASEVRRRSAGEFPWPLGWQPVRLSRPAMLLIMGLAALAAGVTIALRIIAGITAIS